MPQLSLSQSEADALIEIEKHRVDERQWDFPIIGGNIEIPLVSHDKRENFFLDISRGRIDLAKAKYQNRTRQVIILLRLDLGGPPHRNPDGNVIPCPHLHVYREGYSDKWAIPVPDNKFTDVEDLRQALDDFMRYCNITLQPIIRQGLF